MRNLQMDKNEEKKIQSIPCRLITYKSSTTYLKIKKTSTNSDILYKKQTNNPYIPNQNRWVAPKNQIQFNFAVLFTPPHCVSVATTVLFESHNTAADWLTCPASGCQGGGRKGGRGGRLRGREGWKKGARRRGVMKLCGKEGGAVGKRGGREE